MTAGPAGVGPPDQPTERTATMPDHDCDDAIAELYRYLDGELDTELVARVEAHLRSCSPCLEAFDFEAELRRVVASRCREQVPAEVRLRILTVLERLGDGEGGDRPGTPGPDGSPV